MFLPASDDVPSGEIGQFSKELLSLTLQIRWSNRIWTGVLGFRLADLWLG